MTAVSRNLAADVGGYSRLMGEDEAGTAQAVRAARDRGADCARVKRTRVKTMGEGVLLEFPSIVAAVECALAIQKQMAECNECASEGRRILSRIGVDLGYVLVEGRTSSARVNQSQYRRNSRLEPLAFKARDVRAPPPRA